MIALSALVLIVLVWLGVRWGYLALGSLIIGLLLGLVFADSAMGRPIGEAVEVSAAALGQSIKAGFAAVVR